ncbi:MAG TPA: hypothetical protein VHW73_09340, partial [Rudaea sp.]|nr:hypothetical protein [Rudaea sp.]
MNRLTHSLQGFIRSLQISSTRLFAFVEGGIDRPFFDRLLFHACDQSKIAYQITAIKEVSGSAGGKPALLNLFREFRRKGLLVTNAFGKAMACMFFPDKDGDDFTRRRVRSAHVVYSPTYDIEGHLYCCANMHRALADSCRITLAQAKVLIPNGDAWLYSVVDLWKEWIALCLISQKHGVNCGCTFDRVSDVNPDHLAPAEPTLITAYKNSLSTILGVTFQDLDRQFLRALQKVQNSLNDGVPLKYFKGKWLGHLMQLHLQRQPRIPDSNINSIGTRL